MNGWLCDNCRRSVYRKSDGYFCCLAPGMGRISADCKKPMGAPCGFYAVRTDVEKWTFEDLRAWCESLGYGFEEDVRGMLAGKCETGLITCRLSRFSESLGGNKAIDVSGLRLGRHMDGEGMLMSNTVQAEAYVDRLAAKYGIQKRGAQMSLDFGGAL